MEAGSTKRIAVENSVTTTLLAGANGCDTLDPLMVKVRLAIRDVAERAGVSSPYELAKRLELPYETCRLLWQGEQRMVSLKVIERACEVFDVPPGQLFEYKRIDGVQEPKGKRKG